MISQDNLGDLFKSMDGRVIKRGDRVEVDSRHGTKGTGVVLGVRDNRSLLPPTMVLQMDEDTVYSDETVPGWKPDKIRLGELGAFGGEIVRVIPTH